MGGAHGTTRLTDRTREALEDQYQPKKAWKVALASGAEVGVDFPGGSSVTLDSRDPQWVAAVRPEDPTASLYLHSLYYLPMLDELGAVEATDRLLDGYARFSGTEQFARLPVGNASWDHATAMRLRVLPLLAARDERHHRWLESALFDRDLAWACDQANIKPNNHGVMVVGALLSVAAVLRDRQDDREERVRAAAIEGLRRILSFVFGDDGYCVENSPYYSYLYTLLLGVIRDHHSEELARAGLADVLTRTIAAAHATTAVQVYPNGEFVPRGDTDRGLTMMAPPRGTFCSERVGLWVHHGPSLYVMATSGCAALTHKHRDDLQVLVRYENQDFFLDAGFGGYDRKDPRVRALRRAPGHSSLAFAEVDEPGRLFHRLRERGWAGVRAGDDHGRPGGDDHERPAVTLTQGLEGHFAAERQVEVLGDHVLRLTDSWHSPAGWDPLQRFLLPQEARIDVGEASIRVAVGTKELVMDYDVPVDVSVVSAQDEPPYKGWRAVRPGALTPCHCLEVTPADTRLGALGANLLFGDRGSVPASGDLSSEQPGLVDRGRPASGVGRAT